MTTEITSQTALPPTIRLYAQSLSQPEVFKHRAWIGVRVEALLDNYWQSRPSDAVKAEMMADWMEALQNFAPDEIRAACREYLTGSEASRKPKPGDIVALLHKARAVELARFRASQPKPQEPTFQATDVPVEDRRRAAMEIMAKFRGSDRD